MPPTEEGSKAGATFAGGPMLPIEQEVARGLRFTHVVITAMQQQRNETVRFIEALNKLLTAKGITGEAEWADALANLSQDRAEAGV